MADTRGLTCSSCILIVSLKRRARADSHAVDFSVWGGGHGVGSLEGQASLALGLRSRAQGAGHWHRGRWGPPPLRGPCSPVLRESWPAQAEHTPLTPSSKVSMQGGLPARGSAPETLLGGRFHCGAWRGGQARLSRLPRCSGARHAAGRGGETMAVVWWGETVPKASSLGPGSDRAARCLTTKAGSMEGGEAGHKSSVSNRP